MALEAYEIETYTLVNTAWKQTTKILFGEPLGEMKDFDEYLSEAVVGKKVKSSFSGKELMVTSKNFAEGCRFFDYSHEYAQFAKTVSSPFDINKIKDLDSLVETTQERLIYGANKLMGTPKHVVSSDNLIDGTGIFYSTMILRSKYVAYSYLMRENEYTFGSESSGLSAYIIRCCYNNKLQRCFECSYNVGASDCYFVYNSSACSDSMFTFNQRAKRFMIGNVQLDKDAYIKLKPKLISELVSDLKLKKKLDFSIFDIMNEAG